MGFALQCLVGVAIVAPQPQPGGSLLAGGFGVTETSLVRAMAGRGIVVGSDPLGYFRIQPLVGHSLRELQVVVQSGRIPLVLPGTSDEVDRRYLPSVSAHRRYCEGAFLIRTGRLPVPGERSGAEAFQRLEQFLASRVDPETGRVPDGAFRRAIDHREVMPTATMAMLDPDSTRSAAPGSWSFVGPVDLSPPYQAGFGTGTLSGRKNGIAVCQFNPFVVATATAGGGVWGSTNNAETFMPIGDKWPVLSTTCVAINPASPDEMYVGTGDYYGAASATNGIMKTINNGETWSTLGVADFGDSIVTRIRYSPTNLSTLVALVAGPSGDIWRTTDGGATWARTNAPDGDWQDIDVTLGGKMVAVGASKGVWTSTDSGATWTQKATPPSSGGTLWDVACSKLVEDRWYVVCSNRKVFKSTTGGSSWSSITSAHDAACSNAALNWSEAAYNLYVETGYTLTNDIVFVGLNTISASDDEGATWADIARSFESDSKWHSNQHCLQVYPGSGTQAYVGGDGGLGFMQYNSTTNTATFSSLNGTIDDFLINAVTVHPTRTSYVMAGTADNSTAAQRGATGATAWKNLFGGDGAYPAFDRANPTTHYTGGPNGAVYRYTTDPDLVPDNVSPGGGLFVSPLVCAGPGGSLPILGNAAGELRTFNGTTWDTRPTGGGAIRTIGVSKFLSERLYTGATNGDIYRTTNSGGAFAKKDSTLPDRSIGGLAESPFTADNVIVGLQGSGFADVLYRTSNAASATPTWTNISGSGLTGLPAAAVNDVERDPYTNVYYAATDVGAFVSPDSGAHWYNMNAMGLPNAPVTDLWMYSNGGANFLYAATYGRGVWRCLISQRFLTAVVINKPAIYGGTPNTVTVKLNGTAPVGALCTITDNSANVSNPGTVTIPLGSTSTTFTVFTTAVAANQTVTISATCYDTTMTNSFSLLKIPDFTYTPEAPNVYGGDRFNSLIDLHQPAEIVTVATFTDDSNDVSSPSSTSIPEGGQTVNVPLRTLPVLADTPVNVGAKISSKTVLAPVTLRRRPDLAQLSVSPSSVQGGQPSTGKVTLEFIGAAGSLTALLSDTSSLVTTSPDVTIPGGMLSAQFPITTSPVTSTVNVTMKANLRGTTKTALLVLTP